MSVWSLSLCWARSECVLDRNVLCQFGACFHTMSFSKRQNQNLQKTDLGKFFNKTFTLSSTPIPLNTVLAIRSKCPQTVQSNICNERHLPCSRVILNVQSIHSIRGTQQNRGKHMPQPSFIPTAPLVNHSSSLPRGQTCSWQMTMTKSKITFVTGNANKLREVSKILSSDPDANSAFELVSQKIDLPELQGEPAEIAKEKCRLAVKEVNGPTVSNV